MGSGSHLVSWGSREHQTDKRKDLHKMDVQVGGVRNLKRWIWLIYFRSVNLLVQSFLANEETGATLVKWIPDFDSGLNGF